MCFQCGRPRPASVRVALVLFALALVAYVGGLAVAVAAVARHYNRGAYG